MKEFFYNMSAKLFGDPLHDAIEQRQFNIFVLLSAFSNISGSFATLYLTGSSFLFLLNFLIGVVFAVFYFTSRLQNIYRPLFWPLVFIVIAFLSINTIANAGSMGGTYYYFISALVFLVLQANSIRASMIVIVLSAVVTAVLFLIEQNMPEWIVQYNHPEERWLDVFGQYIFALVFTGIIVLLVKSALFKEREKSDKLLLNILPESIADELKKYNSVKPVAYENASVLFTDFSGFTKIAESMTPTQLVQQLDECFSGFDRIIKKYSLEKIKTIGDSYMAVSGIPSPSNDHAQNCVLAAIEIRDYMENLKTKMQSEGKPFWEVRIGIHSGHLVAGVIGHEKFVYDVWGDTVNTASRMESSGTPGKVNISSATYDLIRFSFDCEYRGKVQAKSKGEIEMYYVNGIKK